MESTYSKYLDSRLTYPTSTKNDFVESVNRAIDKFESNRLIHHLRASEFQLPHYQELLLTLFHQVYESSSSFALAGSNCDNRLSQVKSYLFKHAEEEKDHWQWILGDLENTGYKGPDPRTLFPRVNTQAYLSYAFYLALKFPLGRLGMAVVLEGISAKFGTKYGRLLSKELNLSAPQLQFFMMHGELDGGHSAEILDVLSAHVSSDRDWAQLSNVASTTGYLYSQIYNTVLEST